MKCGDSDLLNPPPSTLMHMGIVNDFSWPICIITLRELCCCDLVHTKQTSSQSPNFTYKTLTSAPLEEHRKDGALQRFWCLNNENTALVQAMPKASAIQREGFVCTLLKRCFLSLCLGESKCKRHFAFFPRDWQSLGLLSEVCKDFQKSLNCGGPFEGLGLFMS